MKCSKTQSGVCRPRECIRLSYLPRGQRSARWDGLFGECKYRTDYGVDDMGSPIEKEAKQHV